jgi:transcriptional regulator with XRE-family HTH domain
MPKRNTVNPNMDTILKLVASNSWSAASFATMVGKHKRWLSEVKRGNNLPSPEEAARMCVLLKTTPEEILTAPADIALVKSLLAQDLENGIKKERPADGEALSDMQLEAIEFVKSLPEDKLNRFLRLAKAAFEEDGK